MTNQLHTTSSIFVATPVCSACMCYLQDPVLNGNNKQDVTSPLQFGQAKKP